MKKPFSIVLIIISIILLSFTVSCSNETKKSSNDKSNVNNEVLQSDLKIVKSEISSEAKFYPIKVGKIDMEIFAIKASDGTIRTAFNTCQVCNGTPKAFFKQDNNDMVCQNCMNKFPADMIEKEKGGCNPIPITKENKSENDNEIIISKDFIEKNADKFPSNWKEI